MQLAGAVGGEHDQRRRLGRDRADLGDGDLEVGQQLEQERLELVVGPVDLVDEQHRPVAGPDRLEQRPLEQELRAEQLVDRVVVVELALGQRPDLQHLAGVVPLVERLVGVDALVALQPDQPPAEHRGQHLGHLGLADPDLALEQDRAAERQRDEQRGGQAAVGEVAAAAEQLGQLGDGRRAVGATLAHRRPADRSGAVAAVSVTRAARGPGRGWLPPDVSSLPSRASLSRQAPLRSLPGSAKPSKLTLSMFLHDFVGLQSSSSVGRVLALGGPHRAEHLAYLVGLLRHRRPSLRSDVRHTSTPVYVGPRRPAGDVAHRWWCRTAPGGRRRPGLHRDGLGEDRHGDLGRRVRADVEPGRAVDAAQVGDAAVGQPVGPRLLGPPRARARRCSRRRCPAPPRGRGRRARGRGWPRPACPGAASAAMSPSRPSPGR